MSSDYLHPTYSGPRTFFRLGSTPADGAAAEVTIVGIPFDLGTTNRPGARFGPAALRDASLMLDSGDHQTLGVNPFKALAVVDAGDLEVACGYLEETLERIERQAAAIDGQVVALGGDHTVTLPLLRALARRHGKGISLVHFDAHVDTWKDNFGSPIGHGTPFHQACREGLIDPAKSIQIGIRSPSEPEVMDYTRDELGFTVISAEAVHVQGVGHVVERIRETVGSNKAYLTFDIDSLDPSQAPGTGTPFIGGLFTWQALAIVDRIGDIAWIGMDLVEVAPAYDHAQITALAGATMVWDYLCLLAAAKSSPT